ncbi:MAG TPA: hypothetical protein VH140_08945, partial [Candidatus Acidoferrum sp.]|nr:hypothetical protein [Candidatus Acidoferrum sp.]
MFLVSPFIPWIVRGGQLAITQTRSSNGQAEHKGHLLFTGITGSIERLNSFLFADDLRRVNPRQSRLLRCRHTTRSR